MGDHLSALRLLALVLRDIAAAEAYAIAHLPPSEYATLLQLVGAPPPAPPRPALPSSFLARLVRPRHGHKSALLRCQAAA